MITRFAPSPTGPLHLGHGYSALVAHDMARAAGGTFLLRIEDIDTSRARAGWEAQIFDDLAWLGLDWATPVMRQSTRKRAYFAALDTLWAQGLLYPCTCTRGDIKAAMGAPQEGVPQHGPDGMIYPGTCRNAARTGALPAGTTLRLDMAKVAESLPDVAFQETGAHPGVHKAETRDLCQSVGDFVVARKDMATSYHLAVTVDDAAQNITHVVRGEDIQDATYLHVILQKLLDLPTPTYHHHHLIRDDAGKRLAKRDDARAIAKYRAEGATPDGIRKLVGLG